MSAAYQLAFPRILALFLLCLDLATGYWVRKPSPAWLACNKNRAGRLLDYRTPYWSCSCSDVLYSHINGATVTVAAIVVTHVKLPFCK